MTTTRGALRTLAWVVAGLAVLTVVGFLTVGANGPDDPTLVGIDGFGEIAFGLAPAGAGQGTAGELCALLADNDTQRAQGLQGRSDLAGFDAMVFRFPQDSTAAFHMMNVPVPLSIAWFDGNGRFVSSTDMEPCTDAPPGGCPTYSATGPYRYAIEVQRGGLEGLKATTESVLTVGGDCPH